MLRYRYHALQINVLLLILMFSSSQQLLAAEPKGPDKNVKAFLKQHCFDCHTGDDAEGKLKLDHIKHDFAIDATAVAWEKILQSLQFDEMPPPDEDRPKSIAKAKVILWIEQQMAKSGRAEPYYKKLLRPEYGNYVNHEMLFSGKIRTPAFSPSRIWRISPQIFRKKNSKDIQSPFNHITSDTNIRDYSATSGVDQSTIQTILINTEQIFYIRSQRGEFKLFTKEKRAPTAKELAQVITNEFRKAIGRAPTQQEHARYLAFLKKNISIGGNLDGLKTTIKAMYLSAEAIYRMELGLGAKDKHGRRHLSPNELAYALSYALNDVGPDRVKMIQDAISQKKLNTKQEVAAVVRKILDEGMDSKKTPRIIRFFEEFFGYDKMDQVFKDNSRIAQEDIKQWNTTWLKIEAEQFILHFINRDKDVIKELLTSNRFIVAHPGDNEIARKFYQEALRPDYVQRQIKKRLDSYKKSKRNPQGESEKKDLARIRTMAEHRAKNVRLAIQDGLTPFPGWNNVRGIRASLNDLKYIGPYNLPATSRYEKQKWSWQVEQPFEMPKNQRAGLLTHPAWLAAHSLNDGNDPIRRGHWVYEKLLAGVVQDVPPDVDANVPNDPHKTLRERMTPLRAEKCWRCHRKMNPLGEPFEIFDDWGRHRTHVYFDKKGEIYNIRGEKFKKMLAEGKLTARKINATGEIHGTGNPKVDGKVTDAIEMIHRIGKSDRARQSFIRHLFRYFMGRNEMLSDSQTLIEAEKEYLKNGGSFKALVVSLLSSDSFLYRK